MMIMQKWTIIQAHLIPWLVCLLLCKRKLKCSACRSIFRENWLIYFISWKLIHTFWWFIVNVGWDFLLIFVSLIHYCLKKEIHMSYSSFLAKHKCNPIIQNWRRLSSTKRTSFLLLDKLAGPVKLLLFLLSDCFFKTQYLKKELSTTSAGLVRAATPHQMHLKKQSGR